MWSKMVKLELKMKETGTKTVAIAISNYVPSDVFYVVKYACYVSIAYAAAGRVTKPAV